jgi:hypothetical protein
MIMGSREHEEHEEKSKKNFPFMFFILVWMELCLGDTGL